jgi:hypothetical protein
MAFAVNNDLLCVRGSRLVEYFAGLDSWAKTQPCVLGIGKCSPSQRALAPCSKAQSGRSHDRCRKYIHIANCLIFSTKRVWRSCQPSDNCSVADSASNAVKPCRRGGPWSSARPHGVRCGVRPLVLGPHHSVGAGCASGPPRQRGSVPAWPRPFIDCGVASKPALCPCVHALSMTAAKARANACAQGLLGAPPAVVFPSPIAEALPTARF